MECNSKVKIIYKIILRKLIRTEEKEKDLSTNNCCHRIKIFVFKISYRVIVINLTQISSAAFNYLTCGNSRILQVSITSLEWLSFTDLYERKFMLQFLLTVLVMAIEWIYMYIAWMLSIIDSLKPAQVGPLDILIVLHINN